MAERYYRCSCVRATIFIRVLRVYASAEVGAAFTDLLRAVGVRRGGGGGGGAPGAVRGAGAKEAQPGAPGCCHSRQNSFRMIRALMGDFLWMR